MGCRARPGAIRVAGCSALDGHTGRSPGGGGYTGARIQSRLPDALIRRVVGVLALAIASRYLVSGLD